MRNKMVDNNMLAGFILDKRYLMRPKIIMRLTMWTGGHRSVTGNNCAFIYLIGDIRCIGQSSYAILANRFWIGTENIHCRHIDGKCPIWHRCQNGLGKSRHHQECQTGRGKAGNLRASPADGLAYPLPRGRDQTHLDRRDVGRL